MPAFIKLGDIKGEATDQGHKDWVLITSMRSEVHRIIAEGAKDQQRTKGSTVLADVVLVRQLDKSSPKITEACANGTFFKEVEIRFCTTVKNKQEPYLKYKLENVIVSSYSFHGVESGDPLPSEEIELSFTAVEWTYVVVDPKSGEVKGSVLASYKPGEGRGS